MRGFRRRRSSQATAADQHGGNGQTPIEHAESTVDPRAAMRRIAAEALILQDEAEAVVRGARAREGLGFLAPREDHWYAVSSASEICYRSRVRTRLTKKYGASWMRSCITTP